MPGSVSSRLAASLESASLEHEKELAAICGALFVSQQSQDDEDDDVAVDSALKGRRQRLALRALRTFASRRRRERSRREASSRAETRRLLVRWAERAQRSAAAERVAAIAASLAAWRRFAAKRVSSREAADRLFAKRAFGTLQRHAARRRRRRDDQRDWARRALRRGLVGLAGCAARQLRRDHSNRVAWTHDARATLRTALKRWVDRCRAHRTALGRDERAAFAVEKAKRKSAYAALRRRLDRRRRRAELGEAARAFRRGRRAANGLSALVRWVAQRRRQHRGRRAVVAVKSVRARLALRRIAQRIVDSRRRRALADGLFARALGRKALRRFRAAAKRRRRRRCASSRWRVRAMAAVLRRLRRHGKSRRLGEALDAGARRSRLSRALLALGRLAAAAIADRRRAALVDYASQRRSLLGLERALQRLKGCVLDRPRRSRLETAVIAGRRAGMRCVRPGEICSLPISLGP